MNTTTSLPSRVEKFYVRTLLKRALPFLCHRNWAQHKPMKKNSGKQINFTRFASLGLATTALTEGVTPEGQDLSQSTITATLKQYGGWVPVTDVVTLTNFDPALTEAIELLGEQKGQTVDVLMRDTMLAGTNVWYAGAVSSQDSIITGPSEADLRGIVRFLKNANAKRITRMINPSTGVGTVPIPPCFIAICDTDASDDFEQLSNFTRVEEYASQKGVMENEIGKIGIVRFVETTLGKVESAAGDAVGSSGLIAADDTNVDVYKTPIFGAEAYGESPLNAGTVGVIVKSHVKNDTSDTSDPLNQRSTAGKHLQAAA